MPKTVAEQWTVSVSDLYGVAVSVEETLEAVDRKVGRGSIRHEQLVSARRLPQHGFQFKFCGAGQGNGADFAALALDRQLTRFDCPLGGCGVQPENLMDAQAAVSRQTDRGSVVLAALAPRFAYHAVDLLVAPCAVDLAE